MALLIAVIFRDSLDAGVVGLSLTYAAGLSGRVKKLTKATSDFASDIVSVERLKEYTNEIMAEEHHKISYMFPGGNWPSSGKIAFRRYATKYKPELSYALQGIDMSIKVNDSLNNFLIHTFLIYLYFKI